MAEELNMNVTTCALNGGEDYELLFTVPLTDHEKVSTMKGVKVIGHITKPELGCALVTRDGQEFVRFLVAPLRRKVKDGKILISKRNQDFLFSPDMQKKRQE